MDAGSPNGLSLRRAAWLAVLTALALLGLVARLAYLQLVRGPDLAREAFAQRARVLRLGPARGDILDRTGRPLHGPVLRWRVVAYRPAMRDPEGLARRLAARLGLDPDPLRRRLRAASGPFVVLATVPPPVARELARRPPPGVLVLPQRERYGPRVLAPHALGTVRRAEQRGVSGLERAYDAWLRGEAAPALAALQDARGQALAGGLRLLPARPERLGAHVVTTLDAGLQEAVEGALAATGRPGAAVVVDALSGDVRALASAPAFHPARVAEVLADPGAPLVNRAVRPYPPGSVFKLVVAAAALESGRLGPEEAFPCRGAGPGGRPGASRCPPGRDAVTGQEALALSSNEVFVELARRVGPARLVAWARRLGLGRPTGLGLPEEEAGTLPRPEQLLPARALANAAIGQGPLGVTPVQVARMLAAVAADGWLPGLRLVREVRRADGRVLAAVPPPPRQRVLAPATVRWLRAALRRAVTEGTGRAAEVPGAGAAGKTGSAQAGRVTHAWFAGYVPAYLPRYAIVVLVEGGGSGGAAAAPVFRAIAQRALATR